MSERYLFELGSKKHSDKSPGGIRKKADKEDFPILNGLSTYFLELEPLGVREPHWHINANELCYCISGKAQITLFGDGELNSFQIEPGELAFIPQGYLHTIENIANEKTTFIIGFNNELPEEFGLSTVFSASGNEVMGATFDKDPSFFSAFPTIKKNRVITTVSNLPKKLSPKSNSNKFDLLAIDPQVDVKGGTIYICNNVNFPVINGITLYDLKLNPGGVREPHWHPNAAELDYVISGQARIMIMAPDGSKDVFDVKKGDVVFIPEAYFHYIENIGNDEMHFAIFFNSENPEDVGISGSLGAFSHEIYSAVLEVSKETVAPITHHKQDVFIGSKNLTHSSQKMDMPEKVAFATKGSM